MLDLIRKRITTLWITELADQNRRLTLAGDVTRPSAGRNARAAPRKHDSCKTSQQNVKHKSKQVALFHCPCEDPIPSVRTP